MAIYIKPSKRGSLRKHLGVSGEEKIPASKLRIKEGDSEAIRKKKQFAINARKWKKEDGGFIPEYLTHQPVSTYVSTGPFTEPVTMRYNLQDVNKKAPRKGSRKNADNTSSTHLFEYASYDDKIYAYPTLFQKGNKWIQLQGDEAFKEADKRNELFEFDTNKEAADFAKGSWKPKFPEGGFIPTQDYFNLPWPAAYQLHSGIDKSVQDPSYIQNFVEQSFDKELTPLQRSQLIRSAVVAQPAKQTKFDADPMNFSDNMLLFSTEKIVSDSLDKYMEDPSGMLKYMNRTVKGTPKYKTGGYLKNKDMNKRIGKNLKKTREEMFDPTYMLGPNGEMLPQYGFGDWLKRNAGNLLQTVGGGVATAIGTGLIATGIGAPIGAALTGAGVGMMGSGVAGVSNTEVQNSAQNDAAAQAEQQSKRQMLESQIQPQQSYAWSAYGGKLNKMKKYQQGGIIDYQNGQTHEGPDEGIPVDEQGNPTAKTGGNPIGLTEKGEVVWLTPQNESYVFSNRLKLPGNKKRTFAQEARTVSNKFKLYLGKDFDKPDKLSKEAMDAQLAELMMIQESLKGNTMRTDEAQTMMQQQMQQMQGMQQQMPQEQMMSPEEEMMMQQQQGGMDMGMGMMPQEMPMEEFARGGRLPKYEEPLPGEINVLPNNDSFGVWGFQPEPWEAYGEKMKPILNNPSMIPIDKSDSLYQGGVSPLGAIIPTVGSLLQMGVDRANKPEPIRFGRAKLPLTSLEAQRSLIKGQAGEQRNTMRRAYTNRGVSSGATLAGITAGETGMNRELSRALLESYATEQGINLQTTTQEQQMNLEIEMREKMMNQQRMDAYRGRQAGYVGSIANTWNQYLADDEKSRQYANMLQMTSPYYNLEVDYGKRPGLNRFLNRGKLRKTLSPYAKEAFDD